MAAANPHPMPSIHDTRMPTSRADSGFWAAARMARPTGVKRKNENRAASTHSITAIVPNSWALKYWVSMNEPFGNGVGNGLIVWSKIQPATELKITSRPMNTITLVSTGAFSTGRRMIRWISSPPTNEIATVAKNATQYGQPACISAQAMNVLNIAISPWAKLMWWVDW